MKFNEIFEKYKNGTASVEEIAIVEEEIEKNEIINEYLGEAFEEKLKVNFSEPTKEINRMKKSVNRKINKIVLTTVSLIFIILFMMLYVVSPIIDSFYYAPDDVTVGDSINDIFYDNCVITELNYPGIGARYGYASNKGFGKYEVEMGRENIFTNEVVDIKGEVIQNRKHSDRGMGLYQFEKNPMVIYKIQNPDAEDSDIVNMEKRISDLREMSPKNYVSCYVNFQRDLNSKELYELQNSIIGEEVSFQWVGVRTNPSDVPSNYTIGFSPQLGINSTTDEEKYKEKYPILQLKDVFDADYSTSESKFIKAYETHYISMLEYICDRPRAVDALDVNEIKSEFYGNALKYVEDNGMQCYGALVFAEADKLLDFIDNSGVESIQIVDVRASKY